MDKNDIKKDIVLSILASVLYDILKSGSAIIDCTSGEPFIAFLVK